MMDTSLPVTQRGLLQPDIASKNLILTTVPVPTPIPGSDEHLIRVHTVAPTAGELLWMLNFPTLEPNTKELIPCPDVAGTVISAPSCSPFKVGDEVYARTNYRRAGNAREYTIGKTPELAHRPRKLTWAESAAVPMSSQTAWQALFEHAGLSATAGTGARGKRVLVTAASGGCGAWAVQLARWAGAEVVGTCGPHNVDLVRSLGATEVLDYTTTNFRKWGESDGNKVDVVVDCIGKKSLEDAWWCVRDGGSLISISQPPEQMRPDDCASKDVRNHFFIMEPDGLQLEEISKLVDGGKCRPVVDSVWPLEKFEEAFERLDSGHAKGKVVLDLEVRN